MRHTLLVGGMTCGNCVDHVARALRRVAGVRTVDVSLAANTAVVDGDVELEDLLRAVAMSGYTARAAA